MEWLLLEVLPVHQCSMFFYFNIWYFVALLYIQLNHLALDFPVLKYSVHLHFTISSQLKSWSNMAVWINFWAEVSVQEESLTILGSNSVFIFCIYMSLWCSALTFGIRSALVWWQYAEIECRCCSVTVPAQQLCSALGLSLPW